MLGNTAVIPRAVNKGKRLLQGQAVAPSLFELFVVGKKSPGQDGGGAVLAGVPYEFMARLVGNLKGWMKHTLCAPS